MNHHEVMDINMRTSKKPSKAHVREMRHKRSANGGHVFTHEMEGEDGRYVEPETHTYGKDEGKKVLAHFAKHAGLEDDLPKADPDSAAGAAT